MIRQLIGLDITITNFINRLLPHNQFFDLFFSFFSQKGGSILIWATILLLLIIFEERRDKKFILYFIISFAVTGILTNVVLKNAFHRPRPTSLTCPKNYSFPSGHAAAAFASAVIFANFDKKRKYFYYLVAVLISLSRIYLGCHYFWDVVGGGMVGGMVSGLILRLTLFDMIKSE